MVKQNISRNGKTLVRGSKVRVNGETVVLTDVLHGVAYYTDQYENSKEQLISRTVWVKCVEVNAA